MDADYVDDIELLANTPTQVEFLLHRQEQAHKHKQNGVHVF